ncbi:Beta-lactamase-like protein 2-like protein [Smittium mucronatum]|uniref:Beta-lactamase-like protein 2-like protein n=1 Tax=Smittium mucronatum TaxID=133383 RepID=A0A1R0H3T0_9FUNG|nr:Beta-lactamase-like protein 2-like protein [Smittium mucronatum]
MSRIKPMQLSNLVWQVNAHNPSPYTLMGTNTYIVGTGKNRLLIDTGDGQQPAYFEDLRSVLHEKMDDARINTILLTHWHSDHIGGVEKIVSDPLIASETLIRDATNRSLISESLHSDSGVFANTANNTFYSKIDSLINLRPIPTLNAELLALSKGENVRGGSDFRSKVSSLLQSSPRNLTFSVPGDSESASSSCTVSALPTPGHTDDHISFYLHEENAVFTGDCILGSNSSTVFTNLIYHMNSLQILELIEPTIIYPGHGDIIRDSPKQTIRNNIDHRLNREKKIYDAISSHAPPASPSNLSAENPHLGSQYLGIEFLDLFAKSYGEVLADDLIRGAKFNLNNHLDKLVHENKVSRFISSAPDGSELIYYKVPSIQ